MVLYGMRNEMKIIPPACILAIDIGGTSVKAALVDNTGRLRGDPCRCPTPAHASPAQVLDVIVQLSHSCGTFDAVSIGFPGALKHNIIHTAPNLGTELWNGVDLSALVEARLNCPARITNDATMHGLGIIAGEGIEVVLTLGTGMGFALFRDGVPAPQIELGRHTAGEEPTYDDFVGNAALLKLGETAWKQRVRQTIQRLISLLNFDTLYLGGGNARYFSQNELVEGVRLATNEAGLAGGAKLWRDDVGSALDYKADPKQELDIKVC